MTTADQLAIVRAKLGNDPHIDPLVLADGGLVQGWMKSRRLLVLLSHSSSTSSSRQSRLTSVIGIFVSTSFPVSAAKDLTLETLLPMDLEFKIEIDSGDDAILMKMSNAKHKFMFEMLPGYHTQNFVSEIFRQTESNGKQTEPRDFSWTTQYLPQSSEGHSSSLEPTSGSLDRLSLSNTSTTDLISGSRTSLQSDQAQDMESPESSLNRQEIAMGVSPIAARESVVKYQMATKEDQFTHLKTFTIFIGTWNVNGQAPPTGPVHEWLACDEEPPDLYAIGFQELDLSKEAFVFNESPREDEWRATVTASLHPKAKYKRVKLVRLVGMMLMVFVKEEHYSSIKNVAAESVGTGIMGKLGNKGGVAVRMDFHNTTICFVNSHLAAHVSEYERRNQDYHDINSRMSFQQFMPSKSIKDHDMIYWLGDLNYRITDIDTKEACELIKENNFEDLLAADQLKQQKFQRRSFTGYHEGDITFQPTYKYDPGTDTWDSSEKARAPAWTDRVLWKGEHIDQQAYRSHMELRISDHKPVSALFKSEMKVVDPVKYRRIYEDVMKKLDRLENEFLPQVTVETTEIIFDKIRFIEACTRTLAVANTGQVPVQYEFIKKLNDKSICKPWLSVEPSTGFIMPGDKSDIALEVYVDKKTAGPLNSGQDQMYDILVLHLMGGKDIFITVSGTYQKSSFGASINALCKMTVPISELSAGALMELEGTKNLDVAADASDAAPPNDEPYPVPKELWFLCDLITSQGLQQEQLFLQPGLRSEMTLIRDWLDTGLPVDKPQVSIHSAAETMLIFLESLRDPIVPYNMYSRCIESAQNYLQCKQIVSQLPSHHKQVFTYMCAFLREVIRHSAQNGIDPKILATLFAGIFLRDPPGTNLGTGLKARTHQQLLDQKKTRFIYHFLVNEPDD